MKDGGVSDSSGATRRRGRVAARWILAPWTVAWGIAVLDMAAFGRARSPDLAPYVFGLYGCLAFFAHAYHVAWRLGSWVWRYAAWGLAVALHAALGWWHADDAGARVIYVAGQMTPRGAEPRLFVAVALHAVGALLLTLHAFFLGLGSREAADSDAELERPTALTVPIAEDRVTP